jgi:Predicted outer membrane protein
MKRIFGFYVFLAVVAFVSFGFGTRASNQDDFWKNAARMDMAEIALGNLALQKSQNEEVKKFAQMMVDEHTKTSEELKSLAAAKNVTLPSDLESRHQDALDRLNSRSGADFDRQYMRQMVGDHERAVKMYQRQSERGTDAELKDFAAKTLPALQTHLQTARAVQGSLK